MSAVPAAAAAPCCPVLVYVLCFDEASEAAARALAAAHAWATPMRLRTTTLFESEPLALRAEALAEADDWAARRYVGWLSWRAFEKFPGLRAPATARLDALAAPTFDAATGPDVVPLLIAPVPMRYGDEWHAVHPSLRALWDETLVQHLHPALAHPFQSFLCSYYVARPAHLLRFAAFLRRAVLLLAADARTFADATYPRPVTEAMRAAGMAHYPHMPFLLERLAGAYFQRVEPGVRIEAVTALR